jgi:hypothetical protein
MPEIQPSIAIELNKLHELAIGTARQAVSYAKQAGMLLLQVKEQLPHGKFGSWCETNTSLSERTCQRYMAVALGKEVPLRALAGKTDNLAVLPRSLSEEEIDSLVDGTWVAKWIPKAGHWYTTMTENGAYWVVPDLKRPDQFHVSRLYLDDIEDDEILFSGTRWAESADRVEITLRGFLLSAPENAVWKEFKRTGLTEPFGAPDNHGKIKVIGKDGQELWIRDAS